MYYSKGNYEAFARPLKPDGVDQKSAYLVGAGLASLSAACFMLRDGQMKGERIHILEEGPLPGGACDGLEYPDKGFVIRGGREMEDHFECLWDLFRSIPSLEVEGASVHEEFYWLNKRDPNYSLMRATMNRGQDGHTDFKFALSEKGSMELAHLFMTSDELLYDKKISDVLTDEFFKSNFWLYWRSMFAFETWHSALEMKLYVQRFIHHIHGLPDLSTLKFTKYNQYESLVMPMLKYLEDHGVHFQYDTMVTNVIFDFAGEKKTAIAIECLKNGKQDRIELTKDDLVFVTNGSCTENATLGDHDHVPEQHTNPGEGGCWMLWKNIAKQHESFGHPEKFCSDISATNWESATVTTLDQRIPPYIEKITKRDPFSGRVVTGGIVTCRDSKWLMSWTVNRQPHFKAQPKDQLVIWVYALFTDVEGDYVKKPMKACTGKEITEEWLYHLGVPIDQIPEIAATGAHCVPCMMPYITAFFMPRTAGDRPDVVPKGCENFAFIGEFAETVRDTVFTTEYAVRTAMEGVYTLLNIDRGVPEVWGSTFDVRCLLDATAKLMDGKKPIDMKVPFLVKEAEKAALHAAAGTVILDLLEKYKIV